MWKNGDGGHDDDDDDDDDDGINNSSNTHSRGSNDHALRETYLEDLTITFGIIQSDPTRSNPFYGVI